MGLTVSCTSRSPCKWREEGGMATAAMKLNARGAAKRHISSPLASREYGVVCLHILSNNVILAE